MTKVLTAELTGEALNWATGKADGRPLQIQPAQYGIKARVFVETPSGQARYWPTVDWLQAGELLDKFQMAYLRDGPDYVAICHEREGTGFGSNHRSAACRAVVAAILGDSVDVPEVLL